MDELLVVENLSFSIELASKNFKLKLFTALASNKEILKNISFKIGMGEIVGIAGESGAGKTTLAKLIAGIYKPSGGSIKFQSSGNREKKRINPIQILFQNNGEILNPLRYIEEIVEEAVMIKLERTEKRADPKRVYEKKGKIFSAVNFPEDLRNRKGYQLSGGEQQRAALARILAVDPELLILDEPFSSQDLHSQENFLNLFKKVNEVFGTAIICISHNLGILRKLCARILILYKGEIVESGPSSEVLQSPMHPYTKYLIKAEEYNLSKQELKQNFFKRNTNLPGQY
jgi:ABC-type dipeptide/oligopeptide/nickel transport system ATPase subunit